VVEWNQSHFHLGDRLGHAGLIGALDGVEVVDREDELFIAVILNAMAQHVGEAGALVLVAHADVDITEEGLVFGIDGGIVAVAALHKMVGDVVAVVVDNGGHIVAAAEGGNREGIIAEDGHGDLGQMGGVEVEAAVFVVHVQRCGNGAAVDAAQITHAGAVFKLNGIAEQLNIVDIFGGGAAYQRDPLFLGQTDK